MSKELIKIKWEDLQVGDEFEDGSKVIEISEWDERECYEIKVEKHEPIIVSDSHMMIILVSKKSEKIFNDIFEYSKKQRELIGEESIVWIAARDAYYAYKSNMILTSDNGLRVQYIKPYKDFEKQKVRCISTDTGRYEINGITHHNTARKLFYAMSDTMVGKDCGGPYINAMSCKLPEGHVCEKCASITKGGERIKEGFHVGGWVSTSISEALTQLSMKGAHVGSEEVQAQQAGSQVVMSTLDAWGTSPIIQKAVKAETAAEAREILFVELKKAYEDAGIKQDDFPIQMVAKKLTSYKRNKDTGELIPVKDNEKCDILSMQNIGSYNNIFKKAELFSGYKDLTRPMEQDIKANDVANRILS